MNTRPPHSKIGAHAAAKKAFVLAAIFALGIVAAGCGNNSKDDLANGKTLFIAKCGGCHTLARANTAGAVGPDLDDAFRRARKDGMGSTIKGVVESQIREPSQNLYPSSLVMPAHLVTGTDVADVAAYVSHAAAASGKDVGGLEQIGGGADGKGLFKTNCGSCHTLADAGTSGTTGPNLNNLKPKLPAITKQVTDGGAVMPAFGGTLTKEQIDMIAKYVAGVDGS